MPGDWLRDLRVSDLLTFLTVTRVRSINRAARELRVTPSQVSKAMTRLEQRLDLDLLTRGAGGITLTNTGQEVAATIKQAVAMLELVPRAGAGPRGRLTLAAPSWLNTLLAGAVLSALPDVRLRIIDVLPAFIRGYARENVFDVSFTLGRQTASPHFSEAALGELRIGLLAAPALAAKLGRQPVAPERIKEVPLGASVYNVAGQFVPIDIMCPLPLSERTPGCEIQSFRLAIDLAVGGREVLFGPVLAGFDYLERGQLCEVDVAGWDVRDTLYMACHVDRVLKPTEQRLGRALRDHVADLTRRVDAVRKRGGGRQRGR
jgi:DNA-binding transcriptional LysR family regulator